MSKNSYFGESSKTGSKHTMSDAFNTLSAVADKAFELYKEQKKSEWIAKQKAAGHHVLEDETSGKLISIDIVDTYPV